MTTGIQVTYPMARFGLANFPSEAEVPETYALRLKNRFINAAGGAEKRPGMQQLGQIVPDQPNLTGIHELVSTAGVATLFVSGGGSIYSLSGSTWSRVYTGGTATAIFRSFQMGQKLIFYNGVDRNIYTENGTSFKELRGVVARGEAAGAVSATGIDDADVTDWVNNTDVQINDVVRNITNGGYARINAVTTANCTHTTIGSAGTGLGQTTGNQIAGDRYEIIDTVELNVIPTDGEPDNVAIAGSGTSTTDIRVSGVAFSATEIRAGDFVINTTRSAIALVSAIGNNLTVTSVAGQVAGDSLIFVKPAMPVAVNAHVHYGRGYMIDARDRRRVTVTGIGNPEDVTTDAGTIDAAAFRYADQQPEADYAIDMASYQRFFTIAGAKNIMMFSGTDPIADTSAKTVSFSPVSMFPQGVLSDDSLLSLGNDLVFVSPDGVQSVGQIYDATHLNRANLSEPIKEMIRTKLQTANTDQIILWHYPRRSWLMLKIGDEIYNFNYSAYLGETGLTNTDQKTLRATTGSWSLFDGKFASQNYYFVRQNGNLVCCGPQGMVYTFDVAGAWDDDGLAYKTEYQSAWLTPSSPRKNVKMKQGLYIKPITETGDDIRYEIEAVGGVDGLSRDTVIVSARGDEDTIGQAQIPNVIGGSGIGQRKYSLRWRGEQVRITISTEDNRGPDVISRFTLYANEFGARA